VVQNRLKAQKEPACVTLTFFPANSSSLVPEAQALKNSRKHLEPFSIISFFLDLGLMQEEILN
jgi:hypothetical protein